MRFVHTRLPGISEIEIEPIPDERGYFSRIWCEKEAKAHQVPRRMVQASIAFNRRKGTLRGLHYQKAPSKEGRLLRCISGRAYSVVVDLRPASPTFLSYHALVLEAPRYNGVYVPPGCALGYQTLMEETTLYYQMSAFYIPEWSAGFRWNDPRFGIAWPEMPEVINERDATYPDFDASVVEEFRGYP